LLSCPIGPARDRQFIYTGAMAMLRQTKRRYTINSLDRGLRILLSLGGSDDPLGVSELSRLLGIDKSTTHRIMSTLLAQGFVEQDPATHKYTLGLKVIEVANLKLRTIKFLAAAKPVMRDLMLQSEESVHLAVLVEDEAMYVDTEQGKGIFSVATQIGGKAPLHSSAVGKSLLAELPNEEVNRLLANKGLRRFTERTLVDMQQLHQHLARTREQGCAIDDEETYLGVRCVAATIHDHRGTVVASVGLSGPSQRITDDRLPVLAHLVKEAAAKVSRQLGFVRERPQAAAAAPSLEDPRYVGHCQAGSSAEDH